MLFLKKFFFGILIGLFLVNSFAFAATQDSPEKTNSAIESIIPCFGDSCKKEEKFNPQVDALPQAELREELLPTIARILIYGTGIVSLIVFFVAAAMFIFSSGEEDRITKAKDMIIWGVTGIAFAAGAYILVKAVLDLDF